MADKTPSRSFTIRTSVELYCELSETARKECTTVNHVVNRLIQLGLDREANLNNLIVRLLEKEAEA